MAELNKFFIKVTTLNATITSWDFILWVSFALVAFFYGLLFVSRGRLLPIFVSTFVSLALTQLAPFLDLALGQRFGLTEIYQVKLLAFGVIFVLMLLVLSRVVFQSPVGAETFGMIGAFILAVTQVGLLLAVVVSFLPDTITRQFSNLTEKVFLAGDAVFYWAAAAVFFLLIFARKANREVG